MPRRRCRYAWRDINGRFLNSSLMRRRLAETSDGRKLWNQLKTMACRDGQVKVTIPGMGAGPGNVYVVDCECR